MFANTYALPQVLPSRDVLRFLRPITSPACRDDKRVPQSAIAAMCGMSRLALCWMLWTGRVIDDMIELAHAAGPAI